MDGTPLGPILFTRDGTPEEKEMHQGNRHGVVVYLLDTCDRKEVSSRVDILLSNGRFHSSLSLLCAYVKYKWIWRQVIEFCFVDLFCLAFLFSDISLSNVQRVCLLCNYLDTMWDRVDAGSFQNRVLLLLLSLFVSWSVALFHHHHRMPWTIASCCEALSWWCTIWLSVTLCIG